MVPSANAKVKSTAGDVTVTFTGRGARGLDDGAVAHRQGTRVNDCVRVHAHALGGGGACTRGSDADLPEGRADVEHDVGRGGGHAQRHAVVRLLLLLLLLVRVAVEARRGA